MQIVLQLSFFLHNFKACCGFSRPGSPHAAVSASGSNNGRFDEPPDLLLSACTVRVNSMYSGTSL